jgi:aminopeptidase-like protein
LTRAAGTGSTPVAADVGKELYELVELLYPICRSITGEGVRQTLGILADRIPLEVHEVPSGTRVFDWEVPPEWNIRDAYVADARGERVVDFQASPLHVLSYSVPVPARRLTLDELRPHLYSIPEHPDWIPYRTSYYEGRWGFCLAHNRLLALEDGEYEVCIDSSLEPGSLTYGELLLEGEREGEILVSCHVCHPSLCNDNLSGIAVAVGLARALQDRPRRHTYRFLFVPGTIGPITWLALNESTAGRIRHGLVLACIGDRGHSTYKRSRRGDAEIDRAVAHVLQHSGAPYEILDFSPYGYDERQYCSPGFDLPVGCLMRTPHGRFPEYHTSADDLGFVRPDCLADSLDKCLSALHVVDRNETYVSLNPKCEPQLGKRGLYGTIGGGHEGRELELALLWVLNQSDGLHSLLDVAERSALRFDLVGRAADALLEAGLLEPAT